MKKKNESKMAAVLVSMGLCVVALGAGMTYYTWSNVKEPMTAEESPASPVTVAKSPTLDTAKAQREQMSNDDGEAPDPTPAQEAKTTETKTTSEQKTTEKSTAKAQQTVTYVYPVTGETVMPYSVDKAVYDPTLDQYRTNDTLCIAAEAGTEVKAAADGTVAEIKEDDESGRTLVLEHADYIRSAGGRRYGEKRRYRETRSDRRQTGSAYQISGGTGQPSGVCHGGKWRAGGPYEKTGEIKTKYFP